MAEDKISYAELMQILELIKATRQFSEIHLKLGDMEIDLSRATGQPGHASGSVVSSSPVVTGLPSAGGGAQPGPSPEKPTADLGTQPRSGPVQDWPSNSILIRSPMVGTFYRAPAPGAPPFVEVGQAVEADSTLCIIEVMKLMNSISAGVRGTVTHILAANAQLLEHDQIIMVIQPR